MKRILTTLLLIGPLTGSAAFAGGPHWDNGTITNISAHRNGVMIKLDVGKPPICNTSDLDWMTIRPEDDHILAVVLAAYYSGNKQGTIYVEFNASDNRCYITQWDPIEQ